MSKHTPGPWVAIFPESRCFHEGSDITHYEVMSEKTRGQLSDEGHTHYRKDRVHVDNVSIVGMHFWRDMNDEEAKANARLIAAAPDLLEACQTFSEWLRREDEGWVKQGHSRDTPEGEADWRQWFYENLRICGLAQEQARAAIAKATGEES